MFDDQAFDMQAFDADSWRFDFVPVQTWPAMFRVRVAANAASVLVDPQA